MKNCILNRMTDPGTISQLEVVMSQLGPFNKNRLPGGTDIRVQGQLNGIKTVYIMTKGEKVKAKPSASQN